MTRAREGEDKKAVFRRAKHQRLPAAEQGGKKKREEETRRARAKRTRARPPQKKREVENKSTAANK